MDAVFQEEKKALSITKQKIEDAAFALQKTVNAQNQRIENYVCVDYSDRQELASLKSEARKKQERINELEGYLDSPYFGRMDLDVDDEETTEVVYIGKTGISVNHEFLVADWRSSVGQYFYMKSERKFHVGKTNYTLQLRRALDVKAGKLLSYQTEFDGESVSLEGDVIDPFLLTVLKDKRRQNRLTDIIKTIQGNQNNIIRRPRNESFIVQGCAGSGKTMILLHRLSYLLFNYREIAAESIKIITPNSLFDAHINELSNELGLDRIERKSVEEFYVTLIKGFSRKMDVSADVSSEKDLNVNLLRQLYSEKYFEDSKEHYLRYWSEILCQLNELGIEEIATRLSMEYSEGKEYEYETYRKLDNMLRQLSARVSDEITNKSKLAEKITYFTEEIKEATEKEKELLEKHKKNLESTKVFLKDTLEEKTKTYEQLKCAAIEQKKKISENQKEVESLYPETQKKHEMLSEVQKEIIYLTDYNFVTKRTDIVSKEVLNALKVQVKEIERIDGEIKRTPIYNFGKKNRLKEELSKAIETFNKRAMNYITMYLNTGYDEIKKIDERIEELQQSISEEKAQLDKGMSILRTLKQEITAISECYSLFEEVENPDIAKLNRKTYKLMPTEVKEYEIAYREAVYATRHLNNIKKNLDECEQQYQMSDSFNLSESDLEKIALAIELVDKLKVSEVFRNVMLKDMLDAYRSHGEKYRRTNYRHKLYVKMLFCYLYYRRNTSNAGTFINIDEAQDISKSEYKLMRLILGNRCVFNLYGDVNQLVYEYKGISDWEELSDIVTENIFSLNENYRNTLQITNFCNKEFASDIYPIGISGEEVQELSLASAWDWICSIKKANTEYRAAIIYRHGHSGITTALQQLVDERDVSWFEVDNDKVSVLSVEKAKGLEFDVVVSIVDTMTLNEKYISYTRALDSLVVVREHFEYQKVNEEGIEDDVYEEEFLETESTGTEISNFDKVITEPVEINISSVQKDEDSKQTIIPDVSLSSNNKELVNAVREIVTDAFGDELDLLDEQEKIIQLLGSNVKLGCVAPSGWKKSIILLALAKYNHQRFGKQSILTAEGHLQENELVLAEKLGLKAGSITESMDNFYADFKKEKYDIIFVPYDFFAYESNIEEFVKYFSGKVSYWGIDHPSEEVILWNKIKPIVEDLHAVPFLMSKIGFEGLNLDGYQIASVIDESEPIENLIHTISFTDIADKKLWLKEHALAKLWGQGLVYCETEDECKEIAKILRKSKVKAEAYVYVEDIDNAERINYLANSFSKGGLPILVTTHGAGKNLSNPNIRFMVHYSVPKDKEQYMMHIDQIGKLAEDPVVYDLKT